MVPLKMEDYVSSFDKLPAIDEITPFVRLPKKDILFPIINLHGASTCNIGIDTSTTIPVHQS